MGNEKKLEGVTIRPISRKVQIIDDYTSEAKKKNLIWAVTEADISQVREKMREYYDKTGKKISMTAYIICILARVAEKHKYPVNTIRHKKKKFFIFDDVDVLTNIERVIDGVKKPVNHTVRKANEKTLKEIHNEIRFGQKKKNVELSSSGKGAKRLLKIFPKLPRFLRRMIIHYIFTHPMVKKNILGTIGATAVGMMATKPNNGHMVHITPHTLSLGVGGIGTHPTTVDGEIVNREFIDITIAMDHAIIDGAPATRFLNDLRYGIEYEYLDEPWCFESFYEEEDDSEHELVNEN